MHSCMQVLFFWHIFPSCYSKKLNHKENKSPDSFEKLPSSDKNMNKISKNNIVFLVRSYNEATRIVSVIQGIKDAWFSEVLIIDDGSSDGTRQVIKNTFGTECVYLRHFVNRGGWAAMETGLEHIRRHASEKNWEYVVTFDADDQHSIADMWKFLEKFEQNPTLDIVFGSRFITKTDSNVPWTRSLVLWWGKIFTSIISGIHLTDAHNGYRMFRVKILSHVHLTMDGMEYASEFLDQVQSNHFKFAEVPVNIRYDAYTLAKWQRFGGPFRVATKMIWRKFFR